MSKIKRLTEEEKAFRKALRLRAYPLYLEIEKLKKITTSKHKKIRFLTLKNVIIDFFTKNGKNDDFKVKIYHIYASIDQNERKILGLKERIDHINAQASKIGGTGVEIDFAELFNKSHKLQKSLKKGKFSIFDRLRYKLL